MAGPGGFAKSLAVGALLGLVVVAVAIVAVLAGSGRIAWFAEKEPPAEMLVVAVTDDADGASVAGIILLVTGDGEVEVIDPFSEVAIPGTSYSALRDALAFGGGQAVADAYARATEADPAPEWVVLPADAWQELVDDAGGAAATVPASANIFLNDELYLIEEGQQTLSGAELGALVATEGSLERDAAVELNAAMGEALGGIVAGGWGDVAAQVEAGESRSSIDPALVEAFGSGFAGE